MKKEIEEQLGESLKAMKEAWQGYRSALERGELEEASAYLSGFCTHVETVKRLLEIMKASRELGVNPSSDDYKIFETLFR